VERRAVIVGATSAVGEQLALCYAAAGWRLRLLARQVEPLAAVASDLRLRHGAQVEEDILDADSPAQAEAAGLRCLAGGVPAVIVYVMGSNEGADAPRDIAEQARVHAVNFQSAAAFVAPLLTALEHASGSALAFVGSVAGDRGRSGNFVYGSAKAALDVYAQGLRALLHRSRVSVTTVKLGWVDSRMSWGRSPPALTASPAWAARRIQRAIEARREVVYIPGFWCLVMAVLRAIPEAVFKRLPIP
jgi:short-subunit dehydrogenase